MDKFTNQDIAAMLAVIYKRLEDIEYKIAGGGSRSAQISTYLRELQEKAEQAFR
jgi:hypothetical protein